MTQQKKRKEGYETKNKKSWPKSLRRKELSLRNNDKEKCVYWTNSNYCSPCPCPSQRKKIPRSFGNQEEPRCIRSDRYQNIFTCFHITNLKDLQKKCKRKNVLPPVNFVVHFFINKFRGLSGVELVGWRVPTSLGCSSLPFPKNKYIMYLKDCIKTHVSISLLEIRIHNLEYDFYSIYSLI